MSGSLASFRTEIVAEIAGVGQDLRRGLGDRRAALDQDLAGVRIDDVAAGDPAFELGGGLGSAESIASAS